MIRWELQQATVDTLKSVQGAISENLLGDQSAVFRPLNSNTIVLDYESVSAVELQQRAELFVQHTPGKLFYLSKSDHISLSGKNVPLNSPRSVFCGGALAGLEPDRSLLTESLFLHLDSLSDDAISSVIRANLQVGFRPLLVIFGRPGRDRLVMNLLANAVKVVFSSLDLSTCPLLIRSLMEFPGECIDFEWLNLSLWRIQLRNLSIQHNLSDGASRLKKLSLQGKYNSETGEPDSELCLFAGWLLDQLNSQVIALGREGFECLTASGKTWKFELCSGSTDCLSPIESIQLHFDTLSDKNGALQASISLKEGCKFEISVDKGQESFHSTTDYVVSHKLDSLVKYFSQGDSVATYLRSFERGVELRALAAGGQLSLGVDHYE